MILPAKHLSPDRALITLGAELLGLLERPRTVSALWHHFRKLRDDTGQAAESTVTFDWFVLALDLLFTFGTVDIVAGKVSRTVAI